MRPYPILIGKTITIIDATQPSLIGMTGKLIDETKATFRLQIRHNTKQVLKTSVTLRVHETEQVVSGRLLYGDIRSRIRKK